MRLTSTLLASSALAVCALFASASMGQSGRAEAAGCRAQTFHDERAEGGVCCFTDHFHSGASSGMSSKARATTEAVKAWQDFVWFEYGGAYSHWGIAHSKSVSCSNGNGWSCSVEARACHR